MALSSKLVVVVELSQRDRNYLRRIADAIAPLPVEYPGEADIDDEPTSTAGLGLPTGNKSPASTPPPNRPYVDHVFEGDNR